jgi:hypothetical protein
MSPKTVIPLIEANFSIKNVDQALFWSGHLKEQFGGFVGTFIVLVNLIFVNRARATSFFEKIRLRGKKSPEHVLRSLQKKIAIRAVQENQIEEALYWLGIIHQPPPHGLDAPISETACLILLKPTLSADKFASAGMIIKSVEKLGVDSAKLVSKCLEDYAEKGTKI